MILPADEPERTVLAYAFSNSEDDDLAQRQLSYQVKIIALALLEEGKYGEVETYTEHIPPRRGEVVFYQRRAITDICLRVQSGGVSQVVIADWCFVSLDPNDVIVFNNFLHLHGVQLRSICRPGMIEDYMRHQEDETP